MTACPRFKYCERAARCGKAIDSKKCCAYNFTQGRVGAGEVEKDVSQ
jgi:hypothetical protein